MPKYGWYSLLAGLFLGVACNSADLTPATGGSGSGGDPDPAQDEDPNVLPDGGIAKTTTGDDDDDDDASTALPPKSVGIAMSKNVTIQIEPSDKGAAILAAIKAAQKSVHMTMYLLTDNDIIDALGDLHDAGKDVKVTLNQTFPPNGGDNSSAYSALAARHVDVTYASPTFAYTHEKGIIIDGTTAIIMTMNLATTSPSSNREYIATDTDSDDVATMETIFEADHARTPVTYSSKLVISPQTGNALGSPRDYLTSFINSAKTSLDVEVQELSDEAIVDAIIARQKAGLKLQIIVNGDVNTSYTETAATTKLKNSGVVIHSFHTPYIHAKAIVVDGAQTWVGSQNFTPTALDQNREVGVFTDAASEVAKVKGQIDADYAMGTAL